MFTDIYLLLTVVFCLLHFYVAHPTIDYRNCLNNVIFTLLIMTRGK